MDFTVGIVSRNLATQSNSLDFETVGISYISKHRVSGDTWQTMCPLACLYKTHGKSCVHLHGRYK